MAESLWSIAVFLCIVFTLTHPTVEGFKAGCVLLLSIAIPEIFKFLFPSFAGAPYFTICFFSILVSMTLYCKYFENSRLISNLKVFLLIEIILNVTLAHVWSGNLDRTISNQIFDAYNISLAYLMVNDPENGNWILMLTFAIYYLFVAITLWDWKGRRESVGNGFYKLMANKHLSYSKHIKGLERWEK